jgi:biopolymer transport protein ExbB
LAGVIREKSLNHSAEMALEELQALAESLWSKLDRYLGALATIATIAPLLGLFGTVVGMIEIFGSQGASSGGVANPQQLAHGISIALYNTAFGLLIAIPALAGWRIMRALADQRQRECEECTRQLFKKLYPE